MPVDDTIQYRVQLDTSDVSEQIRSLQDQISSEVSGAAAAGPTMSMDIAGGMSMPDFGGYGPNSMPSLDQIFQSLNQVMAQTQASFDNMGSGAIYNDMSVQNTNPNISGSDVYGSIYSTANQGGPIANEIEAAFGFNYDPRLPISEDAYRKMFRSKGMESIRGQAFLGGAISTIAGIGIGAMAGGPLGSLAGAMFGESVLDTFLPNYEQQEVMNLRSNFMRNVSFRSAGGMVSKTDSRDIAYKIGEWQDSDYASDARMDSSEIDTLMREFAAAGGFDTAMNVDDFKNSVDTLIGNARKVMQTLHMSTQEAAQFMGEMSSMGISNIGEVTSMIGRAPGTMGLTPSEAIQLGMGAANSVAGTGINAGSAFTGVLGMTSVAHDLAGMGAISASTLRGAGGTAGLGSSLYQSAMSYGQSSMGQIMGMSLLGSGSLGDSDLDMIVTAADYLAEGGIDAYYGAAGMHEDLMSGLDPLALYMKETMSFADQAFETGINLKHAPNFSGWLMKEQGHTPEAAKARTGALYNATELINKNYDARGTTMSDIEKGIVRKSPFRQELEALERGIGTAGYGVIAATRNVLKLVNYRPYRDNESSIDPMASLPLMLQLWDSRDAELAMPGIRFSVGGIFAGISREIGANWEEVLEYFSGEKLINYTKPDMDSEYIQEIVGKENEILGAGKPNWLIRDTAPDPAWSEDYSTASAETLNKKESEVRRSFDKVARRHAKDLKLSELKKKEVIDLSVRAAGGSSKAAEELASLTSPGYVKTLLATEEAKATAAINVLTLSNLEDAFRTGFKENELEVDNALVQKVASTWRTGQNILSAEDIKNQEKPFFENLIEVERAIAADKSITLGIVTSTEGGAAEFIANNRDDITGLDTTDMRQITVNMEDHLRVLRNIAVSGSANPNPER